MNSLKFFAELEGEPLRSDLYEGISHLFQPNAIQMVFDGPLGRHEVNPADLAGPVRWSQASDFDVNLFCMYAVTDTVDGEVVDSRVRQFGDSFVLILNLQEFLNRLGVAVKAEGLSGEAKLVEYYDYNTHSGQVGPFKKSNEFSYQQEFRILVRPGLRGPRMLYIGNIEDITSEVMPSVDINDRVHFTAQDAKDAGLIV